MPVCKVETFRTGPWIFSREVRKHHLSFSFLADFGSKSCSAGVRRRMICESEAAKVRVDAATVSAKWSPAYYYK